MFALKKLLVLQVQSVITKQKQQMIELKVKLTPTLARKIHKMIRVNQGRGKACLHRKYYQRDLSSLWSTFFFCNRIYVNLCKYVERIHHSSNFTSFVLFKVSKWFYVLVALGSYIMVSEVHS